MQTGPKLKDRRKTSYDESTNEPPQLIEQEVTDIEEENPSDDTEPMQRVEDQDKIRPPAFEE